MSQTMAFVPRFPLHKPISFVPQTKYVQIGRMPDIDATNCTHFQEVQQPLWEKLAVERLRINEAKTKFSASNANEISKRWSKWDENEIDTYRLQFRVIDFNEDGLIDFNELCLALDEIGDTSSTKEREKYFQEIDVDQSEGVDFEEYLELIHKIQVNYPEKESGLTSMCGLTNGSNVKGVDIVRISHLNLQQQLKYALF